MADSDDDKRMATVTAKIPQEDKEKIVEDLEYGDSISEWVRRAIKARLQEEHGENPESEQNNEEGVETEGEQMGEQT